MASAAGTTYTRADLKRLDEIAKSNQDQSAALAPSENGVKEQKASEGGGKKEESMGISRVPPGTAIAGQLIKLWAEGKLDKISRL